MDKGKVVAMLLAGGQGSRLKLLTQKLAKPAVPFGGKYRIVDFVLSNVTNSGIDHIGILTQYKPFQLNFHIGTGIPWDLSRNIGGLSILPPFMSEDGGRWYTGTANAIFENIDFIDELNPEYVLVLSGDHIYKMDYSEMLKFHKSKGSDVTIATIEVPWEDASRFGILNVEDDNRIYQFDEKPIEPKNNMASMGIYMFNWNILKEYLLLDEKDDKSKHDFGRDVLPLMLKNDERMYAWNFEGYWKDVGTVRSYWESNMDLLVEDNGLNLYDKNWKIYTRNRNLPPQYIGEKGIVINSLVNEGCIIKGEVKNSIIFTGVKVEEGATINNSVILPDVVVEKEAVINNSVVLENIVVGKGTKIGEDDEYVYLASQKEIIRE